VCFGNLPERTGFSISDFCQLHKNVREKTDAGLI
jgi:hypothetical protein